MEVREYKIFTDMASNYINLIRYLRNFRKDELTKRFNQIKCELNFPLSSYRFRIREARKERNKIRRLKQYITDKRSIDTGFTRTQFDSCAYSELTHCVIARIEWIREYREFLADTGLTAKYLLMRKRVEHSLERSEKELRRLMKMRRVLKKSPYKNWDSRFLVCNMEPCDDFSLYDEYIKLNKKVV